MEDEDEACADGGVPGPLGLRRVIRRPGELSGHIRMTDDFDLLPDDVLAAMESAEADNPIGEAGTGFELCRTLREEQLPADDNLAFDTVVKVADHGTIEFPKQLVAARIARSIAVARYRLPLGQPRDS